MKRSLLLPLAILIVAVSAFADSVTVTALGPMQSTNGSSDPPGVFLFSINGVQTMGFPLQTPASPVAGQSWSATVLPFVNFAQASFGSDSDALQDYEAAAWLTLQEPKGGSGGALDIQMAILALFNPGIENSKQWNEGSAMWLSKAEGNSYTLSEFSGFKIVVPNTCMTAGCSALELLVPPGAPEPAPTPEPASMVLVGLGLLALGGTLRKKLGSKR